MLIIPAIDLKDGLVVRLTKGERGKETQYSDDPLKILSEWECAGARMVHVVNLDGAFGVASNNIEIVRKMAQTFKVDLEFGGGLRTHEAVDQMLGFGVKRIVIGTKALDESFLAPLVAKYGERIAVGLDLKDGIIQTHGWESGAAPTLKDTVKSLAKIGVKTIIVTDIHRDGMLTGPNIELLKEVLKMTKIDVIASGGVSKIEDLEVLSKIRSKNLKGVIIGKALYEKKLDLVEAIARFQKV